MIPRTITEFINANQKLLRDLFDNQMNIEMEGGAKKKRSKNHSAKA